MAGAALIASLAGILASTGPFIELRWQTPVTTAPIHEAPEVLGVANDRAVVQHDDDCLLLDATGSVLAKRRFGDAPLALASRQLVALEGAAVVGYATDAGFEARWRLPAVQRTLLPYGTRLSAVEAEHVLLLTGRGCGARCPNESNLDHPSELLAVDAATGAVRWRRSSGREVDEAAAEGDRFLVASRCEAIAYQADSGRLLWRTGRCRRDSDDQSRIALADDAVYFTPAGQKLVKLDPKGGRERWKIPLGGMAATAPSTSRSRRVRASLTLGPARCSPWTPPPAVGSGSVGSKSIDS